MKIKKIKFITLTPAILSPILFTASCNNDNRDSSVIYHEYENAFKKSFNLSLEQYGEKNDKITTAKAEVLDYYFLDYLLLYRDIEDKNSLHAQELNQHIYNTMEIANKIIETNQNTEKYTEDLNKFNKIVAQIENQIEQLPNLLEPLKIVALSWLNHYKYLGQKASESKSADAFSFVLADLVKLFGFLTDKDLNQKWTQIFNKYPTTNELVKEFDNDSLAIQNKLATINPYTNYWLISEYKLFIENAKKLNPFLNEIYSKTKRAFVFYNYFHQQWFFYLSDIARQNKLAKNTQMISENQVDDWINKLYFVKKNYYSKVYAAYKNFTNFIFSIGPQPASINQLKKLGLLDELTDWTIRITSTNNKFISWKNKLNKKQLISKNDNMRNELQYQVQLDFEKIIYQITYQNLSRNYKKE
ncbi:hypothetical protein [Mycoplasmopsis californica]|nr:hypothetical protein [Mycoplasmopsis californica]